MTSSQEVSWQLANSTIFGDPQTLLLFGIAALSSLFVPFITGIFALLAFFAIIAVLFALAFIQAVRICESSLLDDLLPLKENIAGSVHFFATTSCLAIAAFCAYLAVYITGKVTGYWNLGFHVAGPWAVSGDVLFFVIAVFCTVLVKDTTDDDEQYRNMV